MIQFVNSLASEDKRQALHQYFESIMLSGQYTEGPFTKRAELLLGGIVGKPARLVNSCGSALYVMFLYFKGQGHNNIVIQNNTFYATGAMALAAGMKVILCDSREDCPSMSMRSLKQAIENSGATVVVLTHIAGWAAKDYAEIAEYCSDNQLLLVEDCAHSLGVPPTGLLSTAACWSFYSTKAVPIGEGGAISTNDVGLLQFVERYRNYGKHKVNGIIRYDRGMNLRMSEWEAAILYEQLLSFPEIISARRKDAEVLQSIAPCLLEGSSNFYKYPIAVKHASGLFCTGKVYARSDQLDVSLKGKCSLPVSLENSHNWSFDHECLPIGEGIYEGMSEPKVRSLLKCE